MLAAYDIERIQAEDFLAELVVNMFGISDLCAQDDRPFKMIADL